MVERKFTCHIIWLRRVEEEYELAYFTLFSGAILDIWLDIWFRILIRLMRYAARIANISLH